MTALAPTPTVSERWVDYALDPALFVWDAFGVELDDWQAKALRGLALQRRTAVRSGHGVGKTTTLSLGVLWGLTVAGATIPCTAPTQEQLHSVLWPEINRWAYRSPEVLRELQITKTRIALRRDPTVFAQARVGRTPEALAGFHAKRLIYIVDEAAGVPDVSMAVVNGALTTEGARCLMAGNPTRPTGYFVDAFGRNQDEWLGITVSCEDSPRVERSWVLEMEREWGRESDVYRVRVLGLPPQGEETGFIPHALVEQAMRNTETQPDGPLILGVDVARYGSDKTAIACRRGYKVIQLQARHGLSNPQVAGWAAQIADDLREAGEDVAIRVDDGGVGGGVTDMLRLMVQEGTLKATIGGYNFGGAGDMHYATNGGVWWGTLRRLMQDGTLALPADDELRQQLTTRTFAPNLRGKIVLETKEHMRDRGVPSPDKADAVALAFAFHTAEGAWLGAYGLRECAGCGHAFHDPDRDRPCPKCNAKP